MSLSDDKQADIIDALNSTSRYLNDILSCDKLAFTAITTFCSCDIHRCVPLFL